MSKFFMPLLALGTLLGLASAQTTNALPAPPPISSTVQLGHGVNLGNFLEAPLEGEWSGNHLLKADDFSTIREAGFTLIRIPICWSAHVAPAPDYTIDPAFLSRVDWIVAQAKQNNLQAILDYHNDAALMKDPDGNVDRFLATWKQIAEHYKGEPSSILFELLNEPSGKLDAPRWNALLARALDTVRASNPDRSVVVGPVWWNSVDSLPKLVLPPTDIHLIVTVHFYDPMKFTHQGASWINGSAAWLGTTWTGTDAEKQAVTQAFAKAAAWGRENHRPIYLGEFGSFSKGDMDSRARWTTFVTRTAEAHDFAWTYWEFCSGFGVYDPQTHQWRQPLLDALLP